MSKESKRIAFQVVLFLATLVTTTMAGAEWTYGKSVYMESYSFNDFLSGLHFSVPFLLILTVHEFGHYFTARYHKIKSSLPYYIPIPPIPLSIGTMGALIRLRSKVPSNTKNFDIGIAGPLAGFVMALIVLAYGFITLPPAEYIFEIHPEYEAYGLNYAEHVYQKGDSVVDVTIGKTILFSAMEKILADPERMPNAHEIMHYPYLFAGFLALLFTSLNLLPVGQLDGGHVLYGLLGFKKHRIVASVIFVLFIFYSGLGLPYINPALPKTELITGIVLYIFFLYFCFKGLGLQPRDTIMYALGVFALQFLLMSLYPKLEGFSGWLLFGFVIGRFIGIPHPPCEIEEPLDKNRQILGWLALFIFVLCFSLYPIRVTVG